MRVEKDETKWRRQHHRKVVTFLLFFLNVALTGKILVDLQLSNIYSTHTTDICSVTQRTICDVSKQYLLLTK